MSVIWRASALADVERIVSYVSLENPFAAMQIARELVLAGDSLTVFPYRGRPGRVPGTREHIVVAPYIIVYDVSETSGISILRVWHGAQERG
ncbi:MAG: type II toxin-antitoxin system RelE/ParE family toxin [Alphaproteobacteria bacterium]|nr:type II toxin-antitoxin system RelE/ParE family toxin [Alphaproteobacteria bacterium]